MLRPALFVEAFARLHLPLSLAVELGIIELVCIALYVVPRTSILGAILLTGYLGGAIATQLPNSNSLFGEILFPVYVGVDRHVGGIYLRDEKATRPRSPGGVRLPPDGEQVARCLLKRFDP